MREGQFELQILDKDRAVLAERKVAGTNYVEAEAGKEFKVKVTVHKNVDNQLEMKFVIVELSIDGNYLSYHKKMTLNASFPGPSMSSLFLGFKTQDLPMNAYRAFEFSEADENMHHQPNKSSTGCIKADFFEATVTEVKTRRVVTAPTVVSALQVPQEQKPLQVERNQHEQHAPKLTENNKPTEKPSLKICAGRAFTIPAHTPRPAVPPPVVNSGVNPVTNPTSNPASNSGTSVLVDTAPPPEPAFDVSYVWKKVCTEPDATLEIRCHTADTLNFLQEFHADRAARAAAMSIPVDLSTAPEVKQEIKLETGVASSVSGAAEVTQNTQVFDLTKMDTSAMDLTVEPPAEVEFIGGSFATDKKRKKTKKAALVKVERGASGALRKNGKPPKNNTVKPTANGAVKIEPGGQTAKKAKKMHGAAAASATARAAAASAAVPDFFGSAPDPTN